MNGKLPVHLLHYVFIDIHFVSEMKTNICEIKTYNKEKISTKIIFKT